jgi:hypothetical protein
LAIVPTSSWRRFGYARARDIAEKVTVSSVNLLMIWIFSSLLLRSNNNHYLNLSFFFLSFFLFRNFISHVVRFLLMFSTFKRKPLIFLLVIIFTAPPPPIGLCIRPKYYFSLVQQPRDLISFIRIYFFL